MYARIAAIAMAGCFRRTAAGNREYVAQILDQVWPHQPDVVCLPEAFTAKGVPAKSVADVAEPVPGPTTDGLAALAKKHRAYMLCPIYTHRNGGYFNSVVLLDRKGHIEAIYDKRHPWTSNPDYSEFECGVVRGTTDGIFDLDFARIAIRICSDIHFPEDWIELSQSLVKVVFWPSAFNGGALLQAQAIMNHFYIIAAVRTNKAVMINPCGRHVKPLSNSAAFTIADINLDFLVARTDMDPTLIRTIATTYGENYHVESYRDDALCLIESSVKAYPISRLQTELEVISAAEVIARHRSGYLLQT